MLMASVSRRSMLTRYERISSQETAVKGSSGAAWAAAAVIQADHSESSQPARLARRSCDTVRGGNSVRVKKYGCGKFAGPENAPASLRIESGCDLNLANARKEAVPAARNGDGSHRENAIIRATRGVELNVE